MACYLSISEEPAECGGCTREIPPGLIGWTDEIGPRIVAVCPECLDGLDSALARLQQLAAGLLDQLASE